MSDYTWTKPRLLRADEIEARVGQYVEGKGCSLLLYKTARTDMDLLDETFGPGEWENSYVEIKGNLFCAITVHGVTKMDCGTESNQEAEKGEASDAFKRAGVRWGIGRELYTAPFIWVKEADFETKVVKGKKAPKDSFSVWSIKYDDARRITGLKITNDRTHKAVFVYGSLAPDRPTPEKPKPVPKPAPEKPQVIKCDECGKQIDREQAEYTFRRYSKRKLCKECQRKATPDKYKCSACGEIVDFDMATETNRIYKKVLCGACAQKAFLNKQDIKKVEIPDGAEEIE